MRRTAAIKAETTAGIAKPGAAFGTVVVTGGGVRVGTTEVAAGDAGPATGWLTA